MEFSSVWYLSLCSVISLVSLTSGFYALDKAALRVSNTLIILLKCFFFFSMITASSHAFLVRPLQKQDQRELNDSRKLMLFHYFLVFALLSVGKIVFIVTEMNNSSKFWFYLDILFVVLCLLPFSSVCLYDSSKIGNFLTGFFGPLVIYPNHTICWIFINNLYFLLGYIKFYFDFEDVNDLPCYPTIYILFDHWVVSFVIVWFYYCCHVFRPHEKLLAKFNFISYACRKRETLVAIFGLLGILVSQYFTTANSVSLVLTLLCFSVSWLANLAMIRPVRDPGIFGFLISASLECSINLFGFGSSHTWIVFGIALSLVVLRWNLDSISLQYNGMQEIVLRDWKILEQQHNSSFHNFLTCSGPESCVLCPDVARKFFRKWQMKVGLQWYNIDSLPSPSDVQGSPL